MLRACLGFYIPALLQPAGAWLGWGVTITPHRRLHNIRGRDRHVPLLEGGRDGQALREGYT